MVELQEKGSVQLQEIPLHPLHDLREIKGSYEELTARKNYAGTKTDDYLHITLTDEEDIPDVMDRLHTIYPGIMKLDYDNLRTRTMNQIDAVQQVQDKTPVQLFAEFYELQNNQPMSAQQQEHVQKLIDQIWGQGE